MRTLLRFVAAFGRFWWDFLIGDTPELFLAVLVVIGIAVALHRQRAVGGILLVAAVMAFLALSTWRGRSKSASPPGGDAAASPT